MAGFQNNGIITAFSFYREKISPPILGICPKKRCIISKFTRSFYDSNLDQMMR
jgi:hypothetical protein